MIYPNVIASVGIAPGNYSYSQDSLLEYMHAQYNNSQTSRKLNILFKQSGIKKRHSVIPDFDLYQTEKELLKVGQTPNIIDRLKIFKSCALPLAIKAIDNAFNYINHSINTSQVTHVLTITCTGLYAPGLGTEIIKHYNLPVNTFQTGINFMGCNAAFTALRIADSIVTKDPNAIVLIASVELCTIHFQPKDDNDNLLANTIFSDGAAAAIVMSSSNLNFSIENVIQIESFTSLTLSEGKDLMAWNINDLNFEMVLSGEVPNFIAKNFDNILNDVFAEFNKGYPDNLVWAIHPGGKKILDLIKSFIPKSKDTMKYSYDILENFGNMSSATILFVLYKIIENNLSNLPIVCIGFGPGMSVDTILLNIAKSKPINIGHFSNRQRSRTDTLSED